MVAFVPLRTGRLAIALAPYESCVLASTSTRSAVLRFHESLLCCYRDAASGFEERW